MSRKQSNNYKKKITMEKVEPISLNQLCIRNIIDSYTSGRQCCTICGDEDDLKLVNFTDNDKKYFCNFCYNVQVTMK